MIYIVTRTLDWTLPKEHFVRHLRPAKATQSTVMDALDLAVTLRGYGWDRSHKVYFPPETRPANRRGFTLHVIKSAVIHVLLSGVLHTVIGSFTPTSIGAAEGSIFDDTLPFYTRHLRATIISVCASAGIYAFIQLCYDTCTLIAVLVLGQDPGQWPPAFDAPWRATSVSSFWGRRWHQFFRRLFLVQGGYPLSFLFGRVGFIVGTFLSSAVLHHVAMVMLNGHLEAWRLLAGFGMMAPAVLVEMVFKRVTGRRVGGVVGWVWTVGWLLLWGNLIIDGFARAGLFGRFGFLESVVPRRDVVERLMARFDVWLHAM